MDEWVSDLIMGPKLFAFRSIAFSKTARSHPGLREARRDRPEVVSAPAIGRRRLADDVRERAAGRAEAGEPDIEADLGDAAVRLAQECHRALDPAALQVAVRGLAEGRLERPDEVRLRDDRDLRQRRDI